MRSRGFRLETDHHDILRAKHVKRSPVVHTAAVDALRRHLHDERADDWEELLRLCWAVTDSHPPGGLDQRRRPGSRGRSR